MAKVAMSAIKGHVAVVTGASSGIGRAIALGLATQGAKLCLVGRNLKKLEKVVESARSYQVDLMVGKDIREFANRLKKEVGQVDILIHSAGIISMGPFDHAGAEDFDRQYKINTRAPYILTQALLPMMRSCQGQIVFINSSAGLSARANVGQYAATKHALKAIADSLREEVNADGMRVLSLFLGRTATPMQAAIYKTEGRTYKPDLLMQPEDAAAMLISSLCLPRSAEVTDIHIRPLKKI